MRRNRRRPEDPAEPGDPYADGVRLLARREHSRSELRRKLAHKGHEPEALDEALDRLAAQRYQSDARFVETFVRHRVQQGYGPVRIAAELRERGIGESESEAGIAAAGADWQQLAEEALHRRFGDLPPEDAREWAKRARFLQYRGFSADLVRRALKR
ncbi:regulatory protein RecX [Thioalkalivibrio sulfidiphilus]|uniref:Regulatory protein RecX n=1 Tax=Thioalkalivibrio sulfidiphilus (strain HL-EbGR7) TaxID=396588 RepID=B8GQV4_THISH|nr:regulatory protein RecX [Thioalkalivibrio sulfidiphilus]ACL72374.1 regulatory protein RecX [Thioalkalivibrio sulfidiphilus HL-EbGr7]